jgi:hypothetical protein
MRECEWVGGTGHGDPGKACAKSRFRHIQAPWGFRSTAWCLPYRGGLSDGLRWQHGAYTGVGQQDIEGEGGGGRGTLQAQGYTPAARHHALQQPARQTMPQCAHKSRQGGRAGWSWGGQQWAVAGQQWALVGSRGATCRPGPPLRPQMPPLPWHRCGVGAPAPVGCRRVPLARGAARTPWRGTGALVAWAHWTAKDSGEGGG